MKNKNAPGGLVVALRGQILCTGIFHLVPNILIHYNRDAGFIDHKNLFQKNHGRFFKRRVRIHQHMGGLVFFFSVRVVTVATINVGE